MVIDTGPDFRQQMLREGISKLNAVLMTHAHKDHTAGLDDVRSFNFLQNCDMPVYGRPEVLHQIRSEFSYAFSEQRYPGIPRIDLREIGVGDFDLGGLNITPLPVKHLHMEVMGFRIGDFAYITDANFIPDETFNRLIGVRVLILNALQKEKHVSHFNLEEAIQVAARIAAPQTYFTHISHRLGSHSEVNGQLPDGIQLSYDGLRITV